MSDITHPEYGDISDVADGDQIPDGLEEISQTEIPEGTVTGAMDLERP